MRIVDEVPQNNRGKYPWDEIEQAVKAGKVVALDPADYGTTTNAIGTAVRSHAQRNRLDWQVSQREGVLYVSPR